ncbi:MAG: hypothetical protein VR69_17090 [Peptococcaceae bacterium BRH_c4b]|nr:MAG: hypothetical protein VR69_17090 [Peptococcaceae bacterium BRH_c4b]
MKIQDTLCHSERSEESRSFANAQDDNFANAQDDNFANAQDDNFANAQDDISLNLFSGRIFQSPKSKVLAFIDF